MSEVKYYHVCDTGLAEGVSLGRITVVLGADYDAAQSELAALREENANLREGMKGDYDLDAWLDWCKTAKLLEQRLADAERRNESLRVLLRSASTDYACCLESGYDRITQLGGDCDSVEKMLADNPNYARCIAALAKPEEAKS
jgi:hypothetical protein